MERELDRLNREVNYISLKLGVMLALMLVQVAMNAVAIYWFWQFMQGVQR